MYEASTSKTSNLILAGGVAVAVCLTVILVFMVFSSDAKADEADVNLEALTKAYEQHVKSGSKDLRTFETRVNQPDIYSGTDRVSVQLDQKGTLVGFVDNDGTPGYQATDTLVFNLEAEKESEKIVANDRQQRYYSYHSPGIFHYYLISRMLTNQHSYYGGRYYRAPSSARYVKSGYHSRLKRSVGSSSSRSVRSGSFGSRRSSGGSSGFGK